MQLLPDRWNNVLQLLLAVLLRLSFCTSFPGPGFSCDFVNAFHVDVYYLLRMMVTASSFPTVRTEKFMCVPWVVLMRLTATRACPVVRSWRGKVRSSPGFILSSVSFHDGRIITPSTITDLGEISLVMSLLLNIKVIIPQRRKITTCFEFIRHKFGRGDGPPSPHLAG